jgi:hypothetical protein
VNCCLFILMQHKHCAWIARADTLHLG